MFSDAMFVKSIAIVLAMPILGQGVLTTSQTRSFAKCNPDFPYPLEFPMLHTPSNLRTRAGQWFWHLVTPLGALQIQRNLTTLAHLTTSVIPLPTSAPLLMSWYPYLLPLLAFYVVRKALAFKENSRKLSHLPGLRSLFSPASPLGVLLPTCFWNPGMKWQWYWRNQAYAKHGLQTMSVLGYLSRHPAVYTISMDVARQVLALSLKGQLEKSEESTSFIRFWGRNLFTENGAEWSRHRRIMNPAFSPETYALVWDEATSVYREMVDAEGWAGEDEVTIPAMNPFSSKFALIIIGRCGFGQPMPWKTAPNASGIQMTLSEAIRIVSRSTIARLVTPRWVYRLPIRSLRNIETAWKKVDAELKHLVASRRAEMASAKERTESERKDVFRLMIRASDGQGTLSMSDEELAGNTYLLLMAGHESTARTLDAVIGFLALYEDIQEEVYNEIRSGISEDGKLHFQNLPKVQACFLEAARLFRESVLPSHMRPNALMIVMRLEAAAPTMSRDTQHTVVLQTDAEDGHGGQLVLEPGVRVSVDLVGLHHNPKYFPDPEEFRPARWYGVSDNDMTVFSFGPRACIGRRFAVTEGVAYLAHFLLDWKATVVLKHSGETKAQWRARVMRVDNGLTLGVGSVPVRLTRR
ncbi:cytochrome P450 [Mycena epipterygia]|nr:cytochrome P450 [Mycena epipterygia]